MIALERPGGSVSRYETVPPPPSHPRAAANFSYAGRLFKTLLLATRWAPGLHRRPEGGGRIHPGTLFPRGERAFDREMMEEIHGRPFEIEVCAPLTYLPNGNAPCPWGDISRVAVGYQGRALAGRPGEAGGRRPGGPEDLGDHGGISLDTPWRTIPSFYSFRHVSILGRCTSGRGGRILLERARHVLGWNSPTFRERWSCTFPTKRAGVWDRRWWRPASPFFEVNALGEVICLSLLVEV